MGSKKWNKEEEIFLLKSYRELGPTKCGELLFRSKDSCQSKAKILGLTRALISRWSEEEENFIIDNYHNIGAIGCSKKLNRTTASCQQIPSISYLRKGYGNREYHKIYKYDLVDTIIPSKEKFNFEISVEIPKDKEFRDDNTSIQMSIWISGKSRKGKSKKDFFEIFNKEISTDSEFNRYTILGLIQAFGKAINEKI